jgi:hypothetical protein
MTDTLPDISDPNLGPADTLADLTGIVTDAIDNAPRSQQVAIGPSEIGHPCDRRLAYKLNDHPRINSGRLAWKPAIGTAVHAWKQEIVERWNWANPMTDGGPRFIVEGRVHVGEAGGRPISGSSDVYDRLTATNGDYKIVGGDRLRHYREHGPGHQYRVQAHAYGRGYALLGYPMRWVAIWFLPRDREFDKSYFWYEPYDEQIALDALERLDGITKLTDALGAAAPPLLGTADAFCTSCRYYGAGSKDLTKACPGDPAVHAASPALQSLIA